MFGPKIFGQKKIFGQEKFRSKMLLVQKVLVQTDLVSQRYSRPLVSSLFLGRLPFLCHPHFSVCLHLQDGTLANGQLARRLKGVSQCLDNPKFVPIQLTYHWEPNSASCKLSWVAGRLVGWSDSNFIAQLSPAKLGLG